MKWVGITGAWRRTNAEVESDVRAAVAEVIERGDGIVAGGALGVDFIATEEALKHDPTAESVRIIIPSSLEIFQTHYSNRAEEGVITFEQAESLLGLLSALKNRRRESLIEMGHTVLDKKSYYDRNTEVVNVSDELLAFHVNGSAGTQDTIDKAHQKGIPVVLKTYTIQDS